VNRILGPQGITPKFNTVEPKGGLGGENQKAKPNKTTPHNRSSKSNYN
jgi:hypothetical protein